MQNWVAAQFASMKQPAVQPPVGPQRTGSPKRFASVVAPLGDMRSVARFCALLDEPHAGLDAEGRDLLDGLLRDAAAAGSTVVFVSHELDRADAVATRMVTIAGGYAMADVVAESDDVVMEPVRVP